VVALAHLLDHQPAPDEAAVRQALDGHLCRCGSHQRIVQAALQMAAVNRVRPA
jgi:nicotinate dehydrogenase subunit A